MTAEEERIRELKAENQRLQMEKNSAPAVFIIASSLRETVDPEISEVRDRTPFDPQSHRTSRAGDTLACRTRALRGESSKLDERGSLSGLIPDG